MNVMEIKKKVNIVAEELLHKKGYVAPVDVLIKMDVITVKDYEDWRFGRIPYLERVTKCGLGKLSTIMKELRSYRVRRNLKASWTSYKKWGKGKKIDLRFSKAGSPEIEKAYATHLVGMAYKISDESAKNQVEDIVQSDINLVKDETLLPEA